MIVLFALGAAPFVATPFMVVLLTQVIIFGLLATSLSVLAGHVGMASLGQAAFYGAGGYAAGLIAVDVTQNVFVQLAAAMLVGAALALATGMLAVRTHGVQFLMLTVAIAQIASTLALNWDDLTGGSNGLFGIPQPSLGTTAAGVLELDAFVYWYVLGASAAVVLVLHRVLGSPFGQALRGIKQNEPRMRALGYTTYSYKLAAFVLAGGVAGAAGSLTVASQQFLSPADMGFEVSVLALMMVTIGGSGSLWGAFAGAAAVVAVREISAEFAPGQGHLALGVLFILVVFVFPGGFAGRWQGRRHPAAAPAVTSSTTPAPVPPLDANGMPKAVTR